MWESPNLKKKKKICVTFKIFNYKGSYSKLMVFRIGTIKEPQNELIIDFMVQP